MDIPDASHRKVQFAFIDSILLSLESFIVGRRMVTHFGHGGRDFNGEPFFCRKIGQRAVIALQRDIGLERVDAGLKTRGVHEREVVCMILILERLQPGRTFRG